jgi:hypothetical protein
VADVEIFADSGAVEYAVKRALAGASSPK